MSTRNNSVTLALMGASPAAGLLYLVAAEASEESLNQALRLVSLVGLGFVVLMVFCGLISSPAPKVTQKTMPVEAIQKAFAESAARAREAKK